MEETTYTTAQIAAELGMTEEELNRKLIEMGVLQEGGLCLSEEYQDKGYVREAPSQSLLLSWGNGMGYA